MIDRLAFAKGPRLKPGYRGPPALADDRGATPKCHPRVPWRRARRLLREREGATAITFALTLPILIGFIGLSVETSYWYLEKRALQEAADSGALAGAFERNNNAAVSQADMEAAALTAVTKSGYGSLTPDLNNPPDSGRYAAGGPLFDASAVEVVLTNTYNTLFVSLFGLASVDVQARAVAVSGGTPAKACVLALERALVNESGIQVQGSLDLALEDCAVHSNDADQDGFDFNGNPTISTDCITVGGTITGDSDNLTLPAFCLSPKPYMPYVPDPYAGVSVPDEVAAMACESSIGVNTSGGVRTFVPGRYCGDMNLSGDTALGAGIYFVAGDFFETGGTISGEPVILVYTNSDSTFDFRGSGNLAITAPTDIQISDNNLNPTDGACTHFVNLIRCDDTNGDGIADDAFYPLSDDDAADWAGLLIYNASTSDLGAVNNCPNKINGTSDIDAVGAFYFPNTCLVFTGNNKTSGNGTCMQVIAGNIALSGGSAIDNAGCDPSYNFSTYATMVGLVE